MYCVQKSLPPFSSIFFAIISSHANKGTHANELSLSLTDWFNLHPYPYLAAKLPLLSPHTQLSCKILKGFTFPLPISLVLKKQVKIKDRPPRCRQVSTFQLIVRFNLFQLYFSVSILDGSGTAYSADAMNLYISLHLTEARRQSNCQKPPS